MRRAAGFAWPAQTGALLKWQRLLLGLKPFHEFGNHQAGLSSGYTEKLTAWKYRRRLAARRPVVPATD